MVNYSKVLSNLQAVDNLFLWNERPHNLAWRQFTGCDKAHEGVTHLQDILYLCKKKLILRVNLNKSTSSLYFHKIKKIHNDSISQKKAIKKREPAMVSIDKSSNLKMIPLHKLRSIPS